MVSKNLLLAFDEGLGKGEGAQTLRCNLMNRLPSTQQQGEGTERIGLS